MGDLKRGVDCPILRNSFCVCTFSICRHFHLLWGEQGQADAVCVGVTETLHTIDLHTCNKTCRHTRLSDRDCSSFTVTPSFTSRNVEIVTLMWETHTSRLFTTCTQVGVANEHKLCFYSLVIACWSKRPCCKSSHDTILGRLSGGMPSPRDNFSLFLSCVLRGQARVTITHQPTDCIGPIWWPTPRTASIPTVAKCLQASMCMCQQRHLLPCPTHPPSHIPTRISAGSVT